VPSGRICVGLDAWNSFAGVTPFLDRKSDQKAHGLELLVARIWTAIQWMPVTGPPITGVVALNTHAKPAMIQHGSIVTRTLPLL
jgi:hypothetical protein